MTATESSTISERGDPQTAALAIDGLELAYEVRGVPREVLRGVTFQVRPGEAFGLVGESGCGKSTTAYAALRYLPDNAIIQAGQILADGRDVTKMSNADLRKLRANHASRSSAAARIGVWLQSLSARSSSDSTIPDRSSLVF